MFVSKVRNDKVYLCQVDTDSFKPRYVLCYWETKTHPYPELDSLPVIEISFAKCVKCFGKLIPLNPISEYPSFVEYVDIKKPRGRYVWKYGEWVKE